MRDGQRVVITGLGVVAATGIGVEPFWAKLLSGISCIRRVTLCDVTGLDSQIAGEVPDFDPRRFIHPPAAARHMTRTTQLAVAAARLALSDARLTPRHLQRDPPVLVALGVSMGGFDFLDREYRRVALRGVGSILPSITACVNVNPGANVIQQLDLPAQLLTISNSCVGGMDAIITSVSAIRDGLCSLALAGAVDTPIVSSLMGGFCAARLLSTQNTKPERASRPFDVLRDRGVLAEGCAIIVLEEWGHARARCAHIYAEVLGAGASSDRPDLPLSGLKTSMERAISNAGLIPEDIGHISAHGPSDQDLDRLEAEQIRAVFGRSTDSVPVSSIKGVTGNPLSAAGPLQIAAAAMTIKTGWVPPIANCESPDPRCDLALVIRKGIRISTRRILINAHGMGNVNAALVLGPAPQ